MLRVIGFPFGSLQVRNELQRVWFNYTDNPKVCLGFFFFTPFCRFLPRLLGSCCRFCPVLSSIHKYSQFFMNSYEF